ncbi:MAG: S41 family peptidase [Lachnospiraceae bacterium]|nr:S41 family peptidase [Lachnospiraceae bacterium]
MPAPAPVKKKPSFAAGLILGLCLGLAAATAVGIAGYVKLHKIVDPSKVMDEYTINKVNLISDVIDTYSYDYMEDEYTIEEKREGLYRGIVDSIGDKYSAYMTADELAEELEDNTGVYYGIGAYVSLTEEGYPYLSGIMEDTPAERAQLRSGDVIVKVDGESVAGWDLDEAVAHIRGPEGTVVHLTIYREGERDYLEIDVVRGEVKSQTVAHEMLEDDIGYIYIVHFDYVTIEQFAEAYQDIRAQGAKGLIIDLRGNPGGLVTSVVGVARQILPEGLVFYEEESDGNRIEYRCDGTNEIDMPLVVLIDKYSASAAEILSGSIRDHGVGTLVGKNTFGKGIVQDIKQFSDGSAVKLTVSAYYLPNGDNIQGSGIAPDVEVDLDANAYYDEGVDTQLDKAVEVLKSQMK